MDSAIDRLELGVVRTAIVTRTRTPLGAQLAEALAPLPTLEQARAQIDLIGEVRGLVAEREAPPVGAAKDVRASLELGKKGARLDGPQLRAIADTMAAGSALRRFLLAHEDNTPLLYGLGASLRDLEKPAHEISKSFDPDGNLADDASPSLGSLRKRLRSHKDALEEKLADLVHDPNMSPYLQDSYFTVRANRYVVPIKASFKHEVKGIVHDASGSGQTVFIEPQAIVELGNRVKIAQSEVLEEEERILSILTDKAVQEAGAIEDAMKVIGRVDMLSGAARLAEECACAAIVPEPNPKVELLAARHPLLALQKLDDPQLTVVPNDLGLDSNQRILVITGPNTGGKTVAMKTIGLIAVMVRAGLHVPCSPDSRLGWFSSIEAAIGDQQSISTHLSTFAAHVSEVMRILQRADSSSLVLLDEIAADTDPIQGQALAQAVLEALADRGAHVAVTTHFDRLKAVPFSDDRFRNAGVGFDPDKLRPTYRVTLDVPQGSSGIDIAKSLGLSDSIVERARSLIGESQEIDSLMKAIQQKATDLESEIRNAETKARELEDQRQKMREETEKLEKRRTELIEDERLLLVREIEQIREEVRGIIKELQGVRGSDAVKEAMRKATAAAEDLARREEEQRAKISSERPHEETLSSVAVGDWVRVIKLDKDGEVVSVEGQDVLVAVGNMRTRVSLDGLSSPVSKRPKRTRKSSYAGIRAAIEAAPEEKSAPRSLFSSDEELDIRGQKVDESLARLDAFLDHHYSSSTKSVRIIHGHGSGALKMAIREYLKRSGYIRDFRPGDDHEGGDGATIATLA